MICSTSNEPLFDIKLIFCQITPSMFYQPAAPWNSDILVLKYSVFGKKQADQTLKGWFDKKSVSYQTKAH